MGEVRGEGLFLAAEILQDGAPAPARAARLVNLLREERILISATGPTGHILKIRPPLPFSESHAAHVTETIARLLPRI
jgi:4-aminobutyrate aminotransferase-like enzyme